MFGHESTTNYWLRAMARRVGYRHTHWEIFQAGNKPMMQTCSITSKKNLLLFVVVSLLFSYHFLPFFELYLVGYPVEPFAEIHNTDRYILKFK